MQARVYEPTIRRLEEPEPRERHISWKDVSQIQPVAGLQPGRLHRNFFENAWLELGT